MGQELARSTADGRAPAPPDRWWRPLRPDDPRDGWRPLRPDDPRDGWRPDPGVWLTACPRHGPRADTKRRWEVCPVCQGPMGVDARRERVERGEREADDGR